MEGARVKGDDHEAYLFNLRGSRLHDSDASVGSGSALAKGDKGKGTRKGKIEITVGAAVLPTEDL
jgi:hypothetical protein